MARTRWTKEEYDRLTQQERDEMTTPATYFAARPQGGKKWYVNMRTRENGRTFDNACSKGFLTSERAEKEAKKWQDKEDAAVEQTKAAFAKFEAMAEKV